MPFRWQKRIKIAPGIKVSLSPKGVRGVSVGGKRGRLNVSRRGTNFGTTVGGGLSYNTPLSKRGKRAKDESGATTEQGEQPQSQSSGHGCLWWLAMGFMVFLLFSCLISLLG